jgi:hypothetical protein
MSEWWTYRLSDFVLFSPRVYYRLFELHNEALWPAQILTQALGLALIFLLLVPLRGRERIVAAILGLLWIGMAWTFLWQRYASINWAAAYAAPLFVIEGLLLIWMGSLRGALSWRPRQPIPIAAAVALLAFTVLIYPALAAAMGRPWLAAELFGIAPDPTALGTLAVLVLVRSKQRWIAAAIPALWCAISGLTLLALDAEDFFIPPLGALLALGLSAAAARRASFERSASG